MKRYLVVANQTLGGVALAAAIDERIAAGPARFHVLVPATPPRDLYREAVDAYAGTLLSDDDAIEQANARLEHVLAGLRNAGAEASGAIGDPDPLVAIETAVAEADYDEIILSTLPAGASKWLARDLLHRVEKSVSIPVCHVQGKAPLA